MDSINQNLIQTSSKTPFKMGKLSEATHSGEDSSTKGSSEKTPEDRIEIGKSLATDTFKNIPTPDSPKQKSLEFKPQVLALPKPPTPEKEITVLFYINGQYDDIGAAAAEAMISLEKAGSNQNMNVIAQLGRNPYKPQEEGEFHIPLDNDWVGVRRYEVKQSDHKELDIPAAEWHKMEKQKPYNPLIQYILGEIYWAEGQKEKALKYYAKSKDLGMLDYMANYNSESNKKIRAEFQALIRPYEEATASFKKFASEVKEILPEGTKMGDSATLRDFVAWGMEKYPAKHYMLVIMGHGGAWIGAAEQSPADMGKAIKDGISSANIVTGRKDKIDVLAFNSCYMGNVEALYEMKDAADVALGSENYARTGVFVHWGEILRAISKDIADGKPFDGKQFAKELVDFYRAQGKEIKEVFPEFSDWKESYLTLTAIDNTKLDKLANSFGNFIKACDKNKVPDHILFQGVKDAKNYDSNAHNPSELFGFYDTIRDLGSFMDNVRQNPRIPVEVKDAAVNVLKDLKEAIIAEQHEGKGMEGSQGLTFWGPYNATDIALVGKRYTEDVGQFANKSGWAEKLISAAQKVPATAMTGFMDALKRIRELNKKLEKPDISEAEKKTLQEQVKQESQKAVEYKKQMDLTIERSPETKGILNLFKRSVKRGFDIAETSKMGEEMIDEFITKDGMR